ncbi:hypothetical protein DRP77_08665 [Candidatus Poribacteria bacterium]|nr:MAG: hypothetical protein DRP77_08665 [Candidatus Poribacteria bacterium]
MLAALIIMPLAAIPEGTQEVRLEVIADTYVGSHPSEVNWNHGAKTHLRIKGIEDILLFKFDLTPIRGWRIEKATLYLHNARKTHKLRVIGISTVSSDWTEGRGIDEPYPGGACFNYAEYNSKLWAGPQSDFTDVSFSNGNTLACYSEVRDLGNGWLAVEVDPKLVQALVCGDSFGLAVSDEKGQTFANNDVHSRETPFKPYMIVRGYPVPPSKPQPVRDLKVEPFPEKAGFSTGAIKLSFAVPKGEIFRYSIAYRGPDGVWKELPRYLTPHPGRPGSPQEVVIEDLKPDAEYRVRVVTVDPYGNESEPAEAVGRSSPAKPAPKLPDPGFQVRAGGEPPIYSGAIRLWAYPEVCKADPIEGRLTDGSIDYRRGNAVWDGARRVVTLRAAKNEFVAFNLLIEAAKGELRGVRVEVSDLEGGNGSISRANLSLFKAWYVKEDGRWFPEVAVPLEGSFDIPDPSNGIDGQRNQTVMVEIYVPHGTPAGAYRGRLRVEAEGISPVEVPIELEVWDFALPDELTFEVSLNAYGAPCRAFGVSPSSPEGRRIDLEYHRLAHLHRATLNPLPYSQSGNLVDAYVPPVEGEGEDIRVADWSPWDESFGKLLDGSAFEDLPRSGVPITHLYLPFHEMYPSSIKKHYRFRPTTDRYPDLIIEHAMKAPPIEEAFDETFKTEFKRIVRQYVEHFKEKGWTRTTFQFYLNNKYYYKRNGRGTSWWLLDEPMHRDDWLALRFFAELFKEAIEGIDLGGVRVVFRADISRPQWMRDYLKGLLDLMVVSRMFYAKNRLCRRLSEEEGFEMWNYGTANKISEPNMICEAWALKAYLMGANGILPWNSIGRDEAFEKPTPTALIYPGRRFGLERPLASFRLKALRRGQQDVEYLNLLASKRGWDRDQIARAVADLVQLRGEVREEFVDDAGRFVFESLSPEMFEALRCAVARALEEVGR